MIDRMLFKETNAFDSALFVEFHSAKYIFHRLVIIFNQHIDHQNSLQLGQLVSCIIGLLLRSY